MPRKAKAPKTEAQVDETRHIRPATNPEDRENQMIALATEAAEKQLIEGTASSQIIVHYLRLGTQKAKAEVEKLKHEVELLKAKTDAIESDQHRDELYQRAIDALSSYGGAGDDEEEEL